MKLIDKDKVISILQDKIADIKLDMKCGFLEKRKGTEKILMLKHIISLVDTLEVKEVDFHKELLSFYRHTNDSGSEIALVKHFYELGLKAQKGE